MVHGEPGQLVQLGGQLLGRLGRRQTQDGVEPGTLVAGLPICTTVLLDCANYYGFNFILSFLRGHVATLFLLACCPKPGSVC